MIFLSFLYALCFTLLMLYSLSPIMTLTGMDLSVTKDIKPSSALPDTTVYEPTPQPARRTAAAKASNNFFIFYLSEI